MLPVVDWRIPALSLSATTCGRSLCPLDRGRPCSFASAHKDWGIWRGLGKFAHSPGPHSSWGHRGNSVCRGVVESVGAGAILFRMRESLSQGSTKNKTRSGVFVLVPRSGKEFQKLLGVGGRH